MCAVIMCLLKDYCIFGVVFLSNLMLVGGIQNRKMRIPDTNLIDLSEKIKLHHVSCANTSTQWKEERSKAGKHRGMARGGSYELYLESRAKNNGGK